MSMSCEIIISFESKTQMFGPQQIEASSICEIAQKIL